MNKMSAARVGGNANSVYDASGFSKGSILRSSSDRYDNAGGVLGTEQISSLYGNAFVDRSEGRKNHNIIGADSNKTYIQINSEGRKNQNLFSEANLSKAQKSRKISNISKSNSPMKRSSTVTAKARCVSSPSKINQENCNPAPSPPYKNDTVARDQNRMITNRHVRSHSNL